MLITEAQAAEKWCPMVRYCEQGNVYDTWKPNAKTGILELKGLNRKPKAACCIGSECMMWRWVAIVENGSPRRGSCGLASLPLAE